VTSCRAVQRQKFAAANGTERLRIRAAQQCASHHLSALVHHNSHTWSCVEFLPSAQHCECRTEQSVMRWVGNGTVALVAAPTNAVCPVFKWVQQSKAARHRCTCTLLTLLSLWSSSITLQQINYTVANSSICILKSYDIWCDIICNQQVDSRDNVMHTEISEFLFSNR